MLHIHFMDGSQLLHIASVCGCLIMLWYADMVVSHLSVTMRYATLLQNGCYDVTIEPPPLQQLSGEAIVPMTANQQDEVHADIHADFGWMRYNSLFTASEAGRANKVSMRNIAPLITYQSSVFTLYLCSCL